MGRIEKFEDFEAWKKARLLVRDIYKATNRSEFSKDYSLKDQIRHASVSILSNIADHADESALKSLTWETSVLNGQWLQWEIENVAEPNSFARLIDGVVRNERGMHRLSGLGFLDRIQKKCQMPLWDYEIIDEKTRRVRFSYPVGVLSESHQ